MTIFVYGIDHHQAKLALREQLAITSARLPDMLRHSQRCPMIEEIVIVSTCNRTELYCKARSFEPIRDWFLNQHLLPTTELSTFMTLKTDLAAVTHLMRVAVGLESMVLGETEILGQLKVAYKTAQEVGTVGKHLSRLFEMAFHAAKHIRTETNIGAHPISFAYALIKKAESIWPILQGKRVLLLGSGEMTHLVATHLAGLGAHLFFSSRTKEHAEQIAALFNGSCTIAWESRNTFLAQADIVVSSTNSEGFALEKAHFPLPRIAESPLLCIDLAVPRDIDPAIQSDRAIHLYDLDHLNDTIQLGIAARKEAVQSILPMIDKFVSDFSAWQKEQGALEVIQAYCAQAETAKISEVSYAKQGLQAGLSVEEVITTLAHNLTKKLMHTPLLYFKEAAKLESQEKKLRDHLQPLEHCPYETCDYS